MTGDSAAPRVSVLVPSYNHARYVVECLDSVLDDGYPNLELVVLDDGSQDGTFEIVEAWVRARGAGLAGGAHLGRQANQGLVRTLNTLLRSASGAFFTLLASDDRLLPGGIAARVQHLQRRPDLLAVFGDATDIDEDGVTFAESHMAARRGSRAALVCDRTRAVELITRWIMPGPVYLARREVLDRVGFYDERFAFEDRDYYLRILAAGALGYVDRPVAAYRIPRVRPPGRYEILREQRQQIEREMAPRFRGIERLALLAVSRPRPGASGASSGALGRWWDRLVVAFVRRLRKRNRARALRLLGQNAQDGK